MNASEIISALQALDTRELSLALAAGQAELAARAISGEQRDAPALTNGDGGLIDAAAAARMLGVSTSFLYTGRGRTIPVIHCGRRKMYRRADLQKYIDRGGRA